MLWSLIKIIAFVAIVTALTYGATQMLEVPGGVTVDVMNTEFTLTPLQVIFAFVALVVLVWLFLKLLGFAIATFHFLNGDETAISRYFDRNRQQRGYDALSEGMLALASGDGHLAMTKANKAERLLNKPTLTTILSAQAAELTGDKKKAEESYKRLLKADETRFVGVRGLMRQKLAAGETDVAMALAQKAFALKPKHEETQDILLKLQAEKEDWSGARETLNAKLKSGFLPRDVHRRRDAVLALSEAADLLNEGKDIEAREAAIEANRLSPDLVPAAVMAARSYIEQGKARNASRILTKTWGAQPHPELAAAFAEIVPDETPEARIKRFRALTNQSPDDPETKMLLAELYIAAEDFPSAKKALGTLVTDDPTSRSLTLMAAIERGEGASEDVVRAWLAKALTVPSGPQWICEVTGKTYPKWVPHTDGGFDTLTWKRPLTAEVSMPLGTEMLPLLVGPRQGAEVIVAEDVTPEKIDNLSDVTEK